MPYPRGQLLDTEEVIFEIRPHQRRYRRPGRHGRRGGKTALSVVVGVLLVAALIFFLIRLARWFTTEFTLTTDRAIYRHGVLRKQGIETGLDRIDTVVFHQRLFERIIGAGDLVLEHAGDREPVHRHPQTGRGPGPDQPPGRGLREPTRGSHRRAARPQLAAGGGVSKADELAKLDDLRSRGVLSEEEFQQQKAELLGG